MNEDKFAMLRALSRELTSVLETQAEDAELRDSVRRLTCALAGMGEALTKARAERSRK